MKNNKKRYIKVNNKKVEIDLETYRKIDAFDKKQKYSNYNYMKNAKSQYNDNIHTSCYEDVGEKVIKDIFIEKLNTSLEKLTDEERHIIYELFYLGTSERSLAEELSISRSTLQYKRDLILEKLKKFIKG